MSLANDERDDNWGAEEHSGEKPSQQSNERPTPSGDFRSSVSERPPRAGDRRRYDDRRAPYDDRRGGYDDRRAPYDDRRRYDDRRAPYDDFRDSERRFEGRYPPRDRMDDREYGRKRFYEDDCRRPSDRFDSYREGDRYSRRPYDDYGRDKRPKRLREDPSEPNETIGIFNLSYNLTLRDFEEFLADKLAEFSGKFTTKLIVNNQTGSCRGYGFITFDNIDDSIKAKAVLEGGEILGQQYRVAFSIKRGYTNSRDTPSEEPARSELKESENQ